MRPDTPCIRLLASIAAPLVVAACATPTEARDDTSFDVTLSGAVNLRLTGAPSVTVDSVGNVYRVFGGPGANAMIIALGTRDGRDAVSFYVPGLALRPGTYTIRALNTTGPVPAIHAGVMHFLDGGDMQAYEGSAGTLTIESVQGSVARGSFAFQSAGYDLFPSPRTAPPDTPIYPLSHADAPLSASGSFVVTLVARGAPLVPR